MKKVAMSFLGMAFAFMATHASAALIEGLGFIPQSEADPFETIGLVHFVDVGEFDDNWTFSLREEASVSVTFGSVFNDDAGFVIFDIENLETTLLGSSGTLSSFSGNGQTGTLLLGPGDYTLQIAGAGVGLAGGFGVGVLSVITDTSAVPIPAAGLLFFSGIAALGLVRSKRASA